LALTLVVFFSLGFVENPCANFVQAATEINSFIITSETTWTKANSPYELKGPVAIGKGATLTIEPGVQVFFNGYCLQVNGTLVAMGNSNEPVSFIAGEGHTNEIVFMPSSTSWDECSGTGSIIENANIPSTSFKITINGVSPKIASCIGQAMITINGGSPQIDHNQFYGHITSISVIDGEPIISSNYLSDFEIIVQGGSPFIIDNVVAGSRIMKGGDLAGYGGNCIEAFGGNPYIANNNISNCAVAIQIGGGIILNNTISGCSKGVLVVGSFSPLIVYNNIRGYSQSVVLSEGANQDVNATFNWWGTTDTALIDQAIYDFNDNFNLGKVNYAPCLMELNPQAMPASVAPSSTPTASVSASESPTVTSNQSVSGDSVLFGSDWMGIALVAALAVVVLLVFVVVFLRRRR
jgi:hypothetical protein